MKFSLNQLKPDVTILKIICHFYHESDVEHSRCIRTPLEQRILASTESFVKLLDFYNPEFIASFLEQINRDIVV